ncbi:DUF4190 domain-containing protein [Nocardia huaxiensis]|uniref:DUF4190 domain-containing protein n=1 Tax=Nocardia huaxiensis TaxID=2755382 RepID=A0A7D6ZQ02_9NOCA|nr:DUF4190 domain-containing protein [Nocardia huaxiensis]QLY30885.1 DUF4190 domain-containing protein [Nocardia huaxiensis]UFS94396.1 DUF4190 domain-containing protein [Nocardia huaxiensis]
MNAYHAAPQQKTNTLAIVTLVTGILGLCLIPWILGAISLGQIKKSGEKGRGMAIWGMVIAVAWTIIGIIVGVASAMNAESAETVEGLRLLTQTVA